MHYDLFGIKAVARRLAMGAFRLSGEFQVSNPHPVIVRLGTTDVAAYKQVFERGEYDLPLAKAPDVIIDAGANVGMASVYFAQLYPKAKIIAVEPHPETFRILQKNAIRFPQITPIRAALWNREGTLCIQSNNEGSWGMRVSDQRTDLEVRSLTLGTLLRETGVAHVDLLKVDVEGAEREIFEDATNWISGVDVICTELHDRFKDGCYASFEAATRDFPCRWRQGELSCVARGAEFLAV
jgi:FkbM family methyltransferase